MKNFISLRNRRVGADFPCFVIAEAGVNHNGDINIARRLVEVAAASGADAVKFQTFSAEQMASAKAPLAAYQRRTRKESTQRDMLQQLELTANEFGELARECRSRGIFFLSTPFDPESADLLADIGVDAFKISSGDMDNFPLLERITSFGKPMIVSTGMADMRAVHATVSFLKTLDFEDFALLQCVSCYPAELRQVNLRVMDRLQREFGCPVGYSDHTLGETAAIAAVARGACILEKHLTLRTSMPGPDHAMSMDPSAFANLVRCIRDTELALGVEEKNPDADEAHVAMVVRKSIHAARDLAAGESISAEMLRCLRPAGGIPPSAWHKVIGRALARPVAAGARLSFEDLR